MSASPSRAAIDPQVIAAAGSPVASATKPASKSKPASRSKAPSSKVKPVSTASRKPVSAAKKPTSSTTKKATAPKKASPHKPSAAELKISMEDMIKDAIKNDKENVRGGVSRPAIKKYLAFRFKVLDTPANITRLNKAILRGAEKGVFALPKGASGKVKLAKAASESKAPKPVSKTAKPATKPPANKPPTPKAGVKKSVPSKSMTLKKTAKRVPTASLKKVATAKQLTGKKTSSTSKKVKAVAKKS